MPTDITPDETLRKQLEDCKSEIDLRKAELCTRLYDLQAARDENQRLRAERRLLHRLLGWLLGGTRRLRVPSRWLRERIRRLLDRSGSSPGVVSHQIPVGEAAPHHPHYHRLHLARRVQRAEVLPRHEHVDVPLEVPLRLSQVGGSLSESPSRDRPFSLDCAGGLWKTHESR